MVVPRAQQRLAPPSAPAYARPGGMERFATHPMGAPQQQQPGAGGSNKDKANHSCNPHARTVQSESLRLWGPDAADERVMFDEDTGVPFAGVVTQRDTPPPAEGELVLVQFKHGRLGTHRCFCGAVPGVHVLVDGDGGVDLGLVVASRAMPCTGMQLPRVLRAASPDEVHRWEVDQVAWERDAGQTAAALVHNRVPLRIVCAELQWDEAKVTFHFTSLDGHPDFRPILGRFFKEFHKRVWFARYSRHRFGRQQPRQRPLEVVHGVMPGHTDALRGMPLPQGQMFVMNSAGAPPPPQQEQPSAQRPSIPSPQASSLLVPDCDRSLSPGFTSCCDSVDTSLGAHTSPRTVISWGQPVRRPVQQQMPWQGWATSAPSHQQLAPPAPQHTPRHSLQQQPQQQQPPQQQQQQQQWMGQHPLPGQQVGPDPSDDWCFGRRQQGTTPPHHGHRQWFGAPAAPPHVGESYEWRPCPGQPHHRAVSVPLP